MKIPNLIFIFLISISTVFLLALICFLYFFLEIREFQTDAERAIRDFEKFEKLSWDGIQTLIISMGSREKRKTRRKSRRQADSEFTIVPIARQPSIKPPECPSGPAGAPGRPGYDGEPGMNGDPGKDWKFMDLYTEICIPCPAGAPGEPGDVGSEGIRGPPGPKGPPGAHGEPGLLGPVGAVGRGGMPGLRGEHGLDGFPGEIRMKMIHQKGAKGPVGAPGLTGQPGMPGVSIAAQPGTPGIRGRPGMPGFDGKPGEYGKKGTTGEPGVDASYCPCPSRSLEMQKMVDPATERKFSYDYYEFEASKAKRSRKSLLNRWKSKKV